MLRLSPQKYMRSLPNDIMRNKNTRQRWARRALAARLPFDSLDQLRAAMAQAVPALGREGLAGYEWNPPSLPAKPEGEIADYPIKDFYLTNAICRASPTMRRCSDELVHGIDMLEAAE